ncbi:hypothetical protein [Luteolibacter luteus]|uniref:Uncharacterized protein n=1 Tax=Luteolibacter luteus TaxID=2728835 RepID=A0A858RG25_9BACT|nr:hypothetical protein [Luteolibacter luteus]QJE95498.1 hypothetical protein HHL09_06780 [Luteolibacter luteus]
MRFLFFLFVAFPLSVLAQEKSGRTCRLLFLGASESDPKTLQLHDGTKSQEVELPRLNFSKFYPLPSGALTLRLLSAPLAEGQAPPSTAPAAPVAETVGDIYLLVSPDPANKTVPVRMQVIDASADRFKPGQMMWYNLTANDVGGKVGKQQLVLKARSRIITDAPASGNEDYNVNLSYRIAGKDAPYPLCETRWSHDPGIRTVLFVVNEPGSRAPRVMGFPDQPANSGKNP